MSEQELTGLPSIGLVKGSSDIEYIKALLESKTIQTEVANDLHLDKAEDFWEGRNERSIDRLLERLENLVDIREKSGLIRVTAETISPNLSRDIVAAHVRRLTQVLESVNTEKKKLLEIELTECKQQIQTVEEALAKFQRTSKVPMVEEQVGNLELHALLDLNKELAMAEAGLKGVEGQLAAPGDIDKQMQLRTQQAGFKAQVDVLRRFLRERQDRIESIQDSSLRYLRLSRELKTKEKAYELLNEQYYLARSREVERKIPYRIVDRAQVPVEPASRALVVKLGLTAIAGFFFALLIAGTVDAWKTAGPIPPGTN